MQKKRGFFDCDALNGKASFCLLILFVFLLEFIFFQKVILDNNNIPGDIGDSRLVSLIMEHWYKVFGGKEAIRDLSMFYPVHNTLGYSDALLLLSLPYSALRALGMKGLPAYQLTLIATHLFGGICLAWLFRKTLKMPLWACAIGLIMGNYSNSYFMKIVHTQFVTHSLVPLLFIFLYSFYDSFRPGRSGRRMLFGILSIILFSGIVLTSFYVGFFAAFFLLIAHLAIGIYLLKTGRIRIKQIVDVLCARKMEVLTYLATAVIALLPFAWIYLPARAEMGARDWEEVLYYLPNWHDFMNASSTNRIWSFPEVPTKFELQVGYPLVTAIILMASCAWYMKRSIKGSELRLNNQAHTCIAIGFSFAITIVSLLMLRIQNFSLWFLVYRIVPAASAIRAVVRFNHFLSLPAGIVIAFFLSERVQAQKEKRPFQRSRTFQLGLICIVLVGVFFAEHQNKASFANWTKTWMYEYLEAIPEPPDDCESFLLVKETAPGNTNSDLLHLNAWSIANKYDIKTINGYSGQFPSDWLDIKDMDQNGNYTDLLRWVEEYGLENVYLYNASEKIWIECTENALIELES